MQESIFDRYERTTVEEVREDEGGDQAGGAGTEVSLDKRKKQINQFILILEKLPRIETRGDKSLNAILIS